MTILISTCELGFSAASEVEKCCKFCWKTVIVGATGSDRGKAPPADWKLPKGRCYLSEKSENFGFPFSAVTGHGFRFWTRIGVNVSGGEGEGRRSGEKKVPSRVLLHCCCCCCAVCEKISDPHWEVTLLVRLAIVSFQCVDSEERTDFDVFLLKSSQVTRNGVIPGVRM